MNYKEKILDFCKKNRVSTTEVADALGKSGVLHGLKPICQNHYKVGVVRTAIILVFPSLWANNI